MIDAAASYYVKPAKFFSIWTDVNHPILDFMHNWKRTFQMQRIDSNVLEPVWPIVSWEYIEKVIGAAACQDLFNLTKCEPPYSRFCA